jgi:hypothetical protein
MGREDYLPGGKGDKAEYSDFDLDQLAQGLLVEMEHTDDPLKALEIAMDHLEESDKYYDYLEDMEEEMPKNAGADFMPTSEYVIHCLRKIQDLYAETDDPSVKADLSSIISEILEIIEDNF